MTDVRLAWGGPLGALRKALAPHGKNGSPALLVSWWYWNKFAGERPAYTFRDYSLDSGAYSAHMSGAKIDLDGYIEGCKELLANDPQCTEVFALDVLSDWRASMKNTERMWEAGVPAIPVYHVGEPEHLLKHLAREYPKISLGGAVALRGGAKIAWAEQCFARVWPKAIHGLSFGSQRAIMALPFHTVDATNWELGPTRFGNWKSMPGGSIRGGEHPLRMEVDWYLAVERRAKHKWRREMATVNALLAEAGWKNVQPVVQEQGA